jgi:hypothetical protein
VNGIVVIDTNVPIAASERSGQASPACIRACQEAILEVLQDKRRLVLDDAGRIIQEYRQNLSPSGQPGLGDQFLKWVFTNWANPERCVLVAIAVKADAPADFEEFPKVEGLDDFDPSDRKFVAVANAHLEKPPILQALDSKWWGWREALASAGIIVHFLCETEVKETYERKFPERRPRARKVGRG